MWLVAQNGTVTLAADWFEPNAAEAAIRDAAGLPPLGGCYLKNSADGLVAKMGVVACIPDQNGGGGCSYRNDTDVQNDAGGSSAAAGTRADCCAACRADANCRAAAFQPAA